MKNKMISIIVPVYNVREYLDKCVYSIMNQKYRDIEIILVDDGSPDECGLICDKYQSIDSRIRVIHQKNMGLSAARNAGLRIAKGAFVGFVDADDYLHPDMYSILMKTAEDNDADIVACDFEEVYEYTKVSHKTFSYYDLVVCSGIDMYINRYKNTADYFKTVVWNKIYKRETLNNLEFPVGKTHEDEAVIHHYCFNAKRVAYIKLPMYYYLQRDSSIMGIIKKKYTVKRLDILPADEERMDFFEDRIDLIGKDVFDQIVNRYVIDLIDNYYGIKRYVKNKDIEDQIYQKILDIKRYMEDKKVNTNESFMLFIYFPKIYEIYFKARKKLRLMLGSY